MAATAPSTAISGLPRRLVQDGIVDEEAMLQAMEDARKTGATVVAHLVEAEIADSLAVAVAASHE
ncbi:MAG: type IV-A pilus assembly ATPase PilB, partial [Gammaproteobacteria bacterium]|nr:type IV-A pilus assembly ATPase PilB [Gammaproteobacteria bacterium]